MPAETITEQAIIDNFLAKLAGVTVALGYRTDIGLNVFESLVQNLEDLDENTEIPAAVLRTGKDVMNHSGTGQGKSHYDHRLDWTVEALTAGVTATPAWMRKAKYDVQDAIRADDSFGGYAMDCEVETAEPKVAQDGKKVIGVIISGWFDFRTLRMKASQS
jgi:hypothetical protein